MKQPTKDTLREQLALAADEIIRLRTAYDSLYRWLYRDEYPRKPWWRRLWDKCKAACEGDRG